MATDQMKEGFTAKQKITAVALVIILIIIGYQVMGIFKSDTGEVITPAAGTPPGAAANKAPGGAQMAPSSMQNPAPQTLREVTPTMEPRIVDIQKQTQQKYLDQINQLQTLKIQREIAETNQAIAAAKLATVTAEKGVTDLLTRPTQPYGTGMSGVYSSTAVTPPGVSTTTTQTSETLPVPAPVSNDVPYTVVSVTMQLGRWAAILSFQNKLYNVVVGDVVPLDGSVVTSINRNGVTLMKDGKSRRVSILSSV